MHGQVTQQGRSSGESLTALFIVFIVFLSRGAARRTTSILQVCARCQRKTFISVTSTKMPWLRTASC